MRPVRRLSLALGLTLLLIAGAGHTPERSLACSCMGPTSALPALESAEAAFSGRVMPFADGGQFEVYRVWKGDVTTTVSIFLIGANPICLYPFSEGEEYLVFVDDRRDESLVSVEDGVMASSICSGTMPLRYAQEFLEELGPGWAPQPDAVNVSIGASRPVPPVVGTGLAADQRTADRPPAALLVGGVMVAALAIVGSALWRHRPSRPRV